VRKIKRAAEWQNSELISAQTFKTGVLNLSYAPPKD
jgi:hypothetical protein